MLAIVFSIDAFVGIIFLLHSFIDDSIKDKTQNDCDYIVNDLEKTNVYD